MNIVNYTLDNELIGSRSLGTLTHRKIPSLTKKTKNLFTTKSVYDTDNFTSRLPYLLNEHEFNLKDSSINKIFTSTWLDERRCLLGTKCNKLVVLDTYSGRYSVQTPLKSHPKSKNVQNHCGIHSIAINPSRTLLATGAENVNDVAIYSLPDLEPVAVGYNAHSYWIFDMLWLNDDYLVSGSGDNGLALWRVASSNATKKTTSNSSKYSNNRVQKSKSHQIATTNTTSSLIKSTRSHPAAAKRGLSSSYSLLPNGGSGSTSGSGSSGIGSASSIASRLSSSFFGSTTNYFYPSSINFNSIFRRRPLNFNNFLTSSPTTTTTTNQNDNSSSSSSSDDDDTTHENELNPFFSLNESNHNNNTSSSSSSDDSESDDESISSESSSSSSSSMIYGLGDEEEEMEDEEEWFHNNDQNDSTLFNFDQIDEDDDEEESETEYSDNVDDYQNNNDSSFKRRRLNMNGSFKASCPSNLNKSKLKNKRSFNSFASSSLSSSSTKTTMKYMQPLKVIKCKQSKRIRALAFNPKRNEIAAISMNAAFHYFDIRRFEQVRFMFFFIFLRVLLPF
jgi:hypothetical protein